MGPFEARLGGSCNSRIRKNMGAEPCGATCVARERREVLGAPPESFLSGWMPLLAMGYPRARASRRRSAMVETWGVLARKRRERARTELGSVGMGLLEGDRLLGWCLGLSSQNRNIGRDDG